MFFSTKTSPPIKTPTCSSMYGYRGIYFIAAHLTLLPIASMLDATIATTASGGTGSIGVYSVIAISVCIDIVCKWVTDMVKDIQAIDCWFSKFKDFLSEIKDELAFLKYGIIALIYNTGLPNIKYR